MTFNTSTADTPYRHAACRPNINIGGSDLTAKLNTVQYHWRNGEALDSTEIFLH